MTIGPVGGIIDVSKGREQTGRPRRGGEEHTMREYMSIEEYVATMTDAEWFDLMADCYADEMASCEEI